MKNNRLIQILIVVIIALAIYLGYMVYKTQTQTTEKKEAWSAVFLTNGQVYFGKLTGVTDQYVKLNEIYYLQVQKQIQPATETSTTEQPKVSLVKLGNELHGPVDQMNINRDQVLFYEELKSDSKVVQAIEKYKEEKK